MLSRSIEGDEAFSLHGLDASIPVWHRRIMAKVEHFEIPVDDIARAQAFYTSVLGFDYEPWGDEMGLLRQPQD
jgi:hypothetical protein